MTVHGFKDLDVWKKSMALVTRIYLLTKSLPKDEMYGLTSQMRRAAVSIPSNIAEGRGKRSTKDFLRYLNIAYGSSAELETQMLIAENLGYIDAKNAQPIQDQIAEVNRMLNGMMQGLEKKLIPPKC